MNNSGDPLLNTQQSLRNLLYGNAPNGILPVDCGPYENVVTKAYRAYIRGGTEASRRMIETLMKQDVTLYRLVSGDVLVSDTPAVFKPLSFTGLLALPPKEWLISGLVGKRDLIMVFGESGNGKSFLAIDMICAASLGLPFANKFHVPRPLKISYCAGEGSEGLKSRFTAAANHYHVAGMPDYQKMIDKNLTIFTNVPQMFDSSVEDTVNRFIGEWQSREAGELDLLVIDTFHSATSGADENHSRDMGIVLRTARQAIEALGCTVLLVHHANRAGNYRGSSSLHGAMDTMLQARYNKQENVGALECFKLKDAEFFRPLYFRLAADYDAASMYVQWLDKETIQLESVSKAQLAKEAVLKLLESTLSTGLNQSQVVDQLPRFNRKTVLKALEELEKDNQVVIELGPRNSKVYTLAELSSNGQLDRTMDNSPK